MARTSSSVSADNATILMRVNGAQRANAKAKAKTTSTSAPEAETIHAAQPEAETAESLYAKAQEYLHAAFDKIAMPSWTRRLVSTVLSITASAAITYGCLSILDVLVLATALYTGSQFITFLVMFVGIVLTMMACVTVGNKAYELCMEFEVSNVKARVSSWFSGFGSKPKAA